MQANKYFSQSPLILLLHVGLQDNYVFYDYSMKQFKTLLYFNFYLELYSLLIAYWGIL